MNGHCILIKLRKELELSSTIWKKKLLWDIWLASLDKSERVQILNEGDFSLT